MPSKKLEVYDVAEELKQIYGINKNISQSLSQEQKEELLFLLQTVKTANMIHTEVGYDCAKQIKGRKRHVLVDTLGLLIVVVVTAANLPERTGAKLVFAQVEKERIKFWRLVKIWVDGGYRGEEFMKWVMDTYRWILETILRSDQEKGFKILPRRWVVERTFGWFNW